MNRLVAPAIVCAVLCLAVAPGCEQVEKFMDTSWISVPAAPYLTDGEFTLNAQTRQALEADLEGSDVLDARHVGDELYVKIESEAEEIGEGLLEQVVEHPVSWATIGTLVLYIGRVMYKRRKFKPVPTVPPAP